MNYPRLYKIKRKEESDKTKHFVLKKNFNLQLSSLLNMQHNFVLVLLYVFNDKIYSEILLGQASKVCKNAKELSLCHKVKFSNPNIFATRWFKPLIFQKLII